MTVPLSADTITKLRQIERTILCEPERYNQNFWASPFACGTVCCIAGHAVAIEARKNGYRIDRALDLYRIVGSNGFVRSAAAIIGLRSEEAARLFLDSSFWPAPFCHDYAEAESDAARACVAIRRIQHFIETGI